LPERAVGLGRPPAALGKAADEEVEQQFKAFVRVADRELVGERDELREST
jgi:hypothetical protein